MKTILVPYHDEEAARAALGTAIVLAKRFGSYVEGVLVLAEPFVAFVPGMLATPDYLSTAAQQWRQFADGARKDFLKIAADRDIAYREADNPGDGPAAGWREMQGREAEIIGQHGRLFDMIVLGRTITGSSSRWQDVCQAALFESGRPVLLAPTEAPHSIGRTVVIAWNGSTETARTISFGMPFLLAAQRVEVLSVEGSGVPGPTAAEVVTHLAWHGIPATSRSLKPDERPAGEIILDEAGDIGADLILKGAFTRSRFRQIVFGGTTQHILDYARIPVLMAH